MRQVKKLKKILKSLFGRNFSHFHVSLSEKNLEIARDFFIFSEKAFIVSSFISHKQNELMRKGI